MAEQKKDAKPTAPAAEETGQAPLELDMDQDIEEMGRAGKKGLFGRFSARFDEALQSGRGPDSQRDVAAETAGQAEIAADDLAMRRARQVNPHKMVIPEGVIIEGSLTGGSDTEISGRVEGDVTVEGRLFLGASALISGNVRAGSCRVEGLVEGKVECSEDLDLGQSGRLNAEVMAGKRVQLAGQVFGDVTTPGVLRLASTSKVQGNVRVRRLMVEEGATLNGRCTMRTPAQRQEAKK